MAAPSPLVVPDHALQGFEVGAGEPLVVLHGFAAGADSRTEFVPQVAALSEGHRVLMLDLPGFGASGALPIAEDYLEDAVARLLDTLDALGLDRVSVLATSLGAWVALRAAVDHGDRLDRLALLAPGVLHAGSAGARPAEGVRLLSAFLARPTAGAMLDWLESQVADPVRIVDADVERELAQAMVPGAIARLKAVARTFDSGEQESALWLRTSEVTRPVLLIWGRENRDFLLDGALYGARRVPNADLHVLASCGHRPHRERPEAVTRLVLDLLNSKPH